MKCGGQSTLSWSGFSPSIFIWDLGIKFRLPGFVARTFTHRTISLAPPPIVSIEKMEYLNRLEAVLWPVFRAASAGRF